jgi:2-haloacid dehalogenase
MMTTEPPAMPRPEVLVLDVNETLSDLEPMRERFEQVGLPRHALDAWFAATLRDGFALTAAGTYPAFRDVASGALRALLASHGVDKADAVDQVLAGFAELPAHPDVSPGLHQIHAAGIRLVTLTNGATAISDRMLDEAGVLPLLEHRLSVEVPKRWKPHPDAYRYAAEVCGVEPAAMALVAAHPWDVDGAQRAGLIGVWVDRRKTPYPLAFLPPDLQVPDLEALADMLTAS